MGILQLAASALVMAAVTGGAAAAAPADDAHKLAVAKEMFEAWNTRNWDKVSDLFTEDGVLHSMMVEPVVGRPAIHARIAALGAGIERIHLNVRNLGVINGLVYVERVDEFVYKGKAGKVPVVGVLDVQGDKIKEWREYYDRQELLREMGVATDFDHHGRQ